MESTSIITALLAQNEDAVCNRRRIIVLIGEVVLLLASVNPLTAQSAGKTKAAVSADNNKSDTAAANTPLPPADNSCVVLAVFPPLPLQENPEPEESRRMAMAQAGAVPRRIPVSLRLYR